VVVVGFFAAVIGFFAAGVMEVMGFFAAGVMGFFAAGRTVVDAMGAFLDATVPGMAFLVPMAWETMLGGCDVVLVC
jgi:hypothetical protein